MATLLTVVLLLLMMTIMAFYSTKVGLFEQMASSNDTRQKQAFHTAEAGINIFIERIRAELGDVLSSESGGWFEDTSKNWLLCPSDAVLNTAGNENHPCHAETNATRRAESYYFVEDELQPTITAANLGIDPLPAGQSVEVGAVLCPLEVDYSTSPPTVADGCTTDPESEMAITLVARATSDFGRGEAVVKQVFADHDFAGGVPGVPLTAPFVGLPTGTADIVANPNGGGEGVPLSVWSAAALDDSGSFRTCEAYEYYDQYTQPEDISCSPNEGCNCETGEGLSDKFTTYSDVRDNDPDFPDDLFEYFFGVPKAQYDTIKSSMEVVNNCDDFSSASNGAYWVSGSCDMGGGQCQIGTQDNPVFLVASGDFKANGCEFYGMLFITDAETATDAEVSMNGNATVYGAIMIDHGSDRLNGTFAIVYNSDVLEKANKFNGIAALPGGWSDFL